MKGRIYCSSLLSKTLRTFSEVFVIKKIQCVPKKKKCLTGPILKIMKKVLLYFKSPLTLEALASFSATHFSKWKLEMT